MEIVINSNPLSCCMLQKLNPAQYTREDDGLHDVRITYKLRDTVFVAEA